MSVVSATRVGMTRSLAAVGVLVLAGIGFAASPGAEPAAKAETDARAKAEAAAKSATTATATQAPSPVWLKEIPFKIVFETFRDGNWELYMVNADGSAPVNLTKTPDVDEMYPHVSPDGTKVSFVVNSGKGEATRRSAWYMNMDGSGRTKVADDAREAAWNGDGTQLLVLPAEFPSRYVDEDWATKGLAIYDLKTGKLANHPNKDLFHLYNTCWSSDSQWFVTTVHGGMGFSHAIVAFEAAGGGKIFGLGLPGCRPDISPDMKRVVWGADDFHLGIADLDLAPGKAAVRNVRTLFSSPEPMKIYHIDWSPDGKYVAFSRGPQPKNLNPPAEMIGLKAKGWDLCVGNVATGEWVVITTDGQCNKEPDWAAMKASAQAN
jgi:Tol biopolymer transport system component